MLLALVVRLLLKVTIVRLILWFQQAAVEVETLLVVRLLKLVALVAQALLCQRLPPRLQFQRRQFQRRQSRHLASHPEIFAQAFLVQPANHNAGDVLVRQQPRQRNFWIQRAAGQWFFHKHGLA